jgi:hypothetical protein
MNNSLSDVSATVSAYLSCKRKCRSVFSAATVRLRLADVSTDGAGGCMVTRAPPVRGIVRRKLICLSKRMARSGSFQMELIEDAVFVG